MAQLLDRLFSTKELRCTILVSSTGSDMRSSTEEVLNFADREVLPGRVSTSPEFTKSPKILLIF